MAVNTKPRLSGLYEIDETAWLEETARLLKGKRFEELDRKHLVEYLEDMARRDRREVMSRLSLLLEHLLKWEYQSTKRTRSWKATICGQRDELKDVLESKTLRNYADQILAEAYERGARLASIETGINEEVFPSKCPYTLDQILSEE